MRFFSALFAWLLAAFAHAAEPAAVAPAAGTPAPVAAAAQPKPPEPLYETRSKHDPNGIGKFFLGREIAHVMGHQAAGWLERPEREQEERTDLAVQALGLKDGDV